MAKLLLLTLAAAVASLGACTPGEQGATAVPTPGLPASPPVPPPDVPVAIVQGIVARLSETTNLPVFLPSATSPIYFFEDLAGALGTATSDEARQLSARHRGAFRRRSVELGSFSSVVAVPIEAYDPHDQSSCRSEAVGRWVELSEILSNPVAGQYGLFVRVAPKACLPFGGRRFWVSVSPTANWAVVDMRDLGVTEF